MKPTLRLRLAVALVAAMAAALLLHAGLTRWPLPMLLAQWGRATGFAIDAPAPDGAAGVLLTLALLAPAAAWAAARLTARLRRLLRALDGTVMRYREGDFGMSIAPDGRDDELQALVTQHNALGHALREQRQHLAERELLLDTLVQNTPVALLLTDAHRRIVFANVAARHLLGEGRSLQGADFDALVAGAPAALRQALHGAGGADDAVFGVPGEAGEEIFHLSRRSFRLQGRPHALHLLRRMTRELSRQEVATWKRVIRVMSHELNNSLAPISSLAHSGAELARRGDVQRLPEVFATIGARARHLHAFLEGYARFARLPAPRPSAVDWAELVQRLQRQHAFALAGELPARPGWFDAGQIEQALINLLKNAAESGGPPDGVTLAVETRGDAQRLAVCDRGPGMSEAVLAQALLPFYSTKREGSGLGLALAREIAEAHGGRIVLANRVDGGLCAAMHLPLPAGERHG